jgi:hypothetical protein
MTKIKQRHFHEPSDRQIKRQTVPAALRGSVLAQVLADQSCEEGHGEPFACGVAMIALGAMRAVCAGTNSRQYL